VFSNETAIEQIENEMNNVPPMRSDNNLIQEFVSKMETMGEQQKYIEERLNKRDDALIQSLRESQENKKLLLEVKELQQKKTRKGILSSFSRD
jgi:ribosomal protein S1